MTPTHRQADAGIEDRIVRYALGELSDAEARELERELQGDPQRAREARELRQSFELLGRAASAEPPPELRERVLRTAARGDAPAPRRRRWLRRAAVAALAASLATVWIVREIELRREIALLREANDTLAAPNVVLSFDLTGSGTARDAYGKAILDLDAKKAALVVRGLGPLPTGHSYWLWAEVGDETVRCGRFDVPAGTGGVTRQLAIPVREYTEPVSRLRVTVESGTPEQGPSGPTVMASS